MSKNRRHIVDLLFIVALAGVFALSSLLIVVLGINIYKESFTRAQSTASLRTGMFYVCEKIRQSDGGGTVRLAQAEDAPALVVYQTLNETQYETWIFSSGGAVREVTVNAGSAVTKTDGQKIIDAQNLSFTRVGNMLQITASDENGGDFDVMINIMQYK